MEIPYQMYNSWYAFKNEETKSKNQIYESAIRCAHIEELILF